MLTSETFSKGMTMFLSTFTGVVLDKTQLKFYRDILGEKLSDEDFLKSIYKICSEQSEIYPGTNIVALILNALKTEELSSNDQAILAWELVQIAVQNHGVYASVKFVDDPLIHSVILSLSPDGTWVGYDTSLIMDNVTWDRKRFIETYIALSKQPRSHPDYLIGITESDNSLNGYAVGAPHSISAGSLKHERLFASRQNKASIGELVEPGGKGDSERCSPKVAIENIAKMKELVGGIGR